MGRRAPLGWEQTLKIPLHNYRTLQLGGGWQKPVPKLRERAGCGGASPPQGREHGQATGPGRARSSWGLAGRG